MGGNQCAPELAFLFGYEGGEILCGRCCVLGANLCSTTLVLRSSHRSIRTHHY
jgi:hypothetical protein